MIFLLWLLAGLATGDGPAWKPARVAVVMQSSGALREYGPALVSMMKRLLASKPESAQAAVIAFETRFQQLDGGRFRRKPSVLQNYTADADDLSEALSAVTFNGPSPVYDALLQAMSMEKTDLILLASNGIDNASEAEFDEVLKQVSPAVPVIGLYFPAQPPGGGDTRMRKLAKSSGGKFIDIRAKDAWDQLNAALR